VQTVHGHVVPVSFKPKSPQGSSNSGLPFTGENVLEVVLAGLLLTGAGLILRSRQKARA
jgi:LPXTG-motif cell wall-anchored protein